jgi:hypothetical protein
MKVMVLNKLLSSERVFGIRFPYPPISLPTNVSNVICHPELATRLHYTTIVLLSDRDNEPAIFEFSQEIFDGLAAYGQRHHGLQSIEVLISRDDISNKLRIKVGASSTATEVEEMQLSASKYQYIYDGLYNKYLSKIGKKLYDI